MHPFEHWRKEPVVDVTTTKKQHHNPVLLLRRFTDDKRRIAHRNLKTGYVGRAPSATAVGYGLRYFDLAVIGRVSVSAESWLQEVETRAAPLLDRLATDPTCLLAMTDGDHRELARFFASLRFRSPAFRLEHQAQCDHLASWAREMMDGYAKNRRVPAEEHARWKAAPDEAFLPDDLAAGVEFAVLSHLEETDDYATALMGMNWRIGRVADASLFTSDNPVAGAYLRKTDGLGGFSDLLYYIPLSPDVMLRLTPTPLGETWTRGKREEGDWSPYESALGKMVVIAEAAEYLYGESPATPQATAQSIVDRQRDLRGAGQWETHMGGDRYSKIGARGVVRIVTPDDPARYWSDSEDASGKLNFFRLARADG